MDSDEARLLLSRAFGEDIGTAEVRRMCRLWGGMGDVLELRAGKRIAVAKRIRMPGDCSSIGDKRKKDSYEVEANFYEGGHAERLLALGCALPQPFFVERKGDGELTILMAKLVGRSGGMSCDEMRSLLRWLATLHAAYWGDTRADAAVGAGLQPQGTYW